MWNEPASHLPGYEFHGCLRPGPRQSHDIGHLRLSEDVAIIWMTHASGLREQADLIEKFCTAIADTNRFEALAELNDHVIDLQPAHLRFITFGAIEIDRVAGKVTAFAAGDFLPVIKTADGRVVELDRTETCIPLGVLPSRDLELPLLAMAQEWEIGVEHSLIIASPNSLTLMNSACELYGLERLIDQWRAGPVEAGRMIESIADDMEAFSAGRDRIDDISLLGLRRVG